MSMISGTAIEYTEDGIPGQGRVVMVDMGKDKAQSTFLESYKPNAKIVKFSKVEFQDVSDQPSVGSDEPKTDQ